MNKSKNKKLIFQKLIMFLVGFCMYITIEVCFRGYSYISMGMWGGILFLFLDELNNRISWDLDILLQGIVGSLCITLVEFIVGSYQIFFDRTPMWNYSDILLNYKGIICLPFSLIWIGLSIIGIFIADAINYYVFDEQPVPYYKLFGKTIIRYKKKI